MKRKKIRVKAFQNLKIRCENWQRQTQKQGYCLELKNSKAFYIEKNILLENRNFWKNMKRNAV